MLGSRFVGSPLILASWVGQPVEQGLSIATNEPWKDMRMELSI